MSGPQTSVSTTSRSATSDASDPSATKSGLFAALGAYVIWGFLPLYLILVKIVPPTEFVAWRIIWTLPLCLLIVMLRGQRHALMTAVRSGAVMLTLLLTAVLIAINWLVYIWAIQNGEVYAASLGYYINPLLNVVLGTVFLGEKLTRRQWAAVALAACGVALLLGGALTTLWISLTLAASFGTYGLLRKRVDVGAVPGLTIESAILILPAMAAVVYFAGLPAGSSFGNDLSLSLLIMLGGVLTAVPLLLFAIAARRMAYSTLGFIQFLAPTIVFILGLTVFGQELKTVQLACFILIWSAAAIFVWDIWARQQRPPLVPSEPAKG
ncbi:Protein RarD [Alteripontixanthobacter maritimus]|uniref:Protein RarD n=1 Tax=Alteripontixanthobacter maritimus TaxID=2161824 RepID=A0A369Q7Q1_9SPHN|nr:EamA family transporter RarD [Alteripontixanthobacter maritimus]RDC60410.1 Protein RarD [Alteripontixanthobacter maritimus]